MTLAARFPLVTVALFIAWMLMGCVGREKRMPFSVVTVAGAATGVGAAAGAAAGAGAAATEVEDALGTIGR